MRTAKAKVDAVAAANMQAFDALPPRVRAFMKTSARSFKAPDVLAIVETYGEEAALAELVAREPKSET